MLDLSSQRFPNISIINRRTPADTDGWSPHSVNYTYQFFPLYQLRRATPIYGFGPRPLDDPATTERDEERPGEQVWTHDYLGSMRSWSAIEETVGEHFYDWSIGEIVNGQQLIEAGATDNPSDPQARGISARCSAIAEAADRLSGPAPHALYFAYQPTETPNEFNALEACYDAAGNMVALFRVNLTACTDVDPLDETTVSWNCTESVSWSLSLTWDSVGRLVDIYKTDPSEGNTHIQNVYDSGNSRVIRLDHESSKGDERVRERRMRSTWGQPM